MESPKTSSGQEIGTLLVLVGVIAPLLSVAVVGGYGFCVWMYQLIVGPPTG